MMLIFEIYASDYVGLHTVYYDLMWYTKKCCVRSMYIQISMMYLYTTLSTFFRRRKNYTYLFAHRALQLCIISIIRNNYLKYYKSRIFKHKILALIPYNESSLLKQKQPELGGMRL